MTPKTKKPTTQEITVSEWRKALDEFEAEKVPEGAKTCREIMKEMGLSLGQTRRFLAKLIDAGKAERFKVSCPAGGLINCYRLKK